MLPKNAKASASTPEQVLNPRPRTFMKDGAEIKIFPVPDRVYMHISDDLAKVIAILDSALNILTPDPDRQLQAADFVPLLPQILQALLPNATLIIAACLRLDEQEVADDWWPDEKFEALRHILIAHDVQTIVKKFAALVETVRDQAAPTSQANPIVSPSTEDGSTPPSAGDTAGS